MMTMILYVLRMTSFSTLPDDTLLLSWKYLKYILKWTSKTTSVNGIQDILSFNEQKSVCYNKVPKLRHGDRYEGLRQIFCHV